MNASAAWETTMSDLEQRRQAVDPTRSVIVQAPAGSGKTTLLVERYLGLLAVVDAPEEILAITFTRKAAAEMRHRILQYLDPAFESDEPHEQAALAKARAVGERIREWGLRDNPQRMLIRTIDSFNHYLARTMPVASQLGPVPAPAENTRALYREAARRVLEAVDGQDELAADLKRLLLWRDHRSQDIEDLLVSLLGQRDQWLRALGITGRFERSRLEQVLRNIVISDLSRARQIFDEVLIDAGSSPAELSELLRLAAATLDELGRPSVITHCADLAELPAAEENALPGWRGLAEALLTQKGEFRRSVTVSSGFPPRTSHKDRMSSLLERIGHRVDLAESLDRARSLPDPRFEDAEWETLSSLVRVLRHAATELELVFANAGKTDFAGLASAALRGLGDADSGYTDLALYLDRRIRHILVDEYQDTNWNQYELLERLVGGWQGDDARSLFLVGDPMQSIYRFREAEVGLFMRTRDQGLGGQALESLRLTRNFRSRSEIVEWVNNKLGPIFPHVEDVAAGAVGYSASEPGRSAGGAVELLARADAVQEAQAIAERIETTLRQHQDEPDFRAAIIVRARSHLREIIPALGRKGIAYRALKLDPLTQRPLIQDLLALTRAILNPADTTATLAVLRSPWCGLNLAALHVLAGDGRRIDDEQALSRLDGDQAERAERTLGVLSQAQRAWRKRPIRDLVEGAWQALGGPACCHDPAVDLRDAGVLFEALSQAEQDGLLEDWNDFSELLENQFTQGDPPSDEVRVDLLTLHGAKGLEWDLVILPGLGRATGRQDRTLLSWLPFTPDNGQEQVLLAPLRAADQASDPPLNRLIRAEQNQRDAYERQRLLYVAATRAREQLVLTTVLDPSQKEIKPASASLLADLWPKVGAEMINSLHAAPEAPLADQTREKPDQGLYRVPSGWQPSLTEALAWRPPLPPRERSVEIEFNWAGIQARRSGTVIHRLLEQVGRIGIEQLSDDQRNRLLERIPALLKAMGSGSAAVAEASESVRRAFEQALDSDIGRWLLSGKHRDSDCELAISGVLDGQLVNAIIDRTFIDDEGVRWIVDYKSGYHAGGDLDGFLDQEAERYQSQLDIYRRLFGQMGDDEIRTALYLPQHGALRVVHGETGTST
jgi:ATP-dependent helicase/nuclease subunit A